MDAEQPPGWDARHEDYERTVQPDVQRDVASI